MPYKNKKTQNDYQNARMQRLRIAWLKDNGPCKKCGSSENLEVDHIDRTTKISHRVWSWSEQRRVAELAKCQVLCRACHINKTCDDLGERILVHGTVGRGYDRGCKCSACLGARAKQQREYRKVKRLAATAATSTHVNHVEKPDWTGGQYPTGPQSVPQTVSEHCVGLK